MSGIKISPKYGVNPTIPVCFWCGKQKNEIALMGHMKDDIEVRGTQMPVSKAVLELLK